MPLHVSSTCAHHQEVKITLHSLWYHHTYRWLYGAPVHETAEADGPSPVQQINCHLWNPMIHFRTKNTPVPYH